MSEELIGQVVDGEITHIAAFGAFVKMTNGEEGLVHISEVANEFVTDITKFVAVGDKVKVKIMARNAKGKLELSVKRTVEVVAPEPTLFINKKTKNGAFEERMTTFLKKSEEKQIDIRRNMKHKQGMVKKRK